MNGRDFSAELFGPAPAAEPAGRDFSEELFGAPTRIPPEVQAERDQQAVAIIEAERKKHLAEGNIDLAETNAREIARIQKKQPTAGRDMSAELFGAPKKEEPGFFGRLKESFMEVGVPQAQAGLAGLTVTAQAEQIAKTADRLKQLEATGKGESKEAEGLRKTLDFYTKRQGTYFADLAGKQAQLSKAPIYEGVKELSNAKTFSEGFKAFAKDPVNIVANLTAQSLPTAIPGLVLGVINPTLGAAAMGGSSFGVEFGGSLLEFAQENGVDTSDPKALASFFANKELLREGIDKAGTRAGIIGAGDLFLSGLASKTLVPKKITGPVAKNVTNVAAQMGTQAVGGGGFEAAAQVATEGKITKPGEVLAEMFGELGTAPVEVYTQTREAAREAKRAREEAKPAAAPIPEEERIEPSMGSEREVKTKQAEQQLVAFGFPEAEAKNIAARMTDEELAAVQERAAVKAEEELAKPPSTRIEAKQQEFIDAGFDPVEARLRAESAIAEEDEADALAKAEAEGAPDVAGTVERPSGVSVPVVEQPSTGVPAAEGVAEPERTGVVPAGPDVAGTVEGERVEPVAVTETPAAKRGRPALSPEEKAAADERRKVAKNTSRRADSAVTKLNALLDAKLNPDNFADDAAFAEAETELNKKRAAALREVLMLEPDVRGSAAGKRVKAVLARPEIPSKQLADVKQGVDLARKGPARAESAAAAAPAREEFKTNANGVQSLGTIIKGKAAPALKAIAQRLRGVNAGVKFQVIEKDDPLPPVLQKYKDDWDASRGLFIQNDATGERSIYAKGSSYGADQGVNDITVLHENLHAATNQKLYLGLKAIDRGFSENSQLVRATRDLIDIMRRTGEEVMRLNKLKQLPPAIGQLLEATDGKIIGDPREFLAYGMSDPDFQQFLMGIRGVEEDTSFFTRFVDIVRRLLGMSEDQTNALTDLIVATDKIISARKTPTMYFLERAEKQAAQKAGAAEKVSAQAAPTPPPPRTEKEAEKDVAVAKEKVRVSREAEVGSLAERLQKARKAEDVLKVVKDAWGSMTAAQREATVRLPTFDFLARWMEKDIPRIAEASTLLQKMNGMSMRFLEGAEQLTSTMRRAFADDPELKTKLADVVYTSTLARLDPANPDTKVRSKTLDDDYAALGESGQKLYVMLRDYYKSIHELYRTLLDQQVESIPGLTQEAKQNVLAKIKLAYEKGERIDPFFPLVRRGDYWLSVGSGKQRQFFMYETQGERDAAARQMAAERRTGLDELLDSQKMAIGNNVGELRTKSVDRSSSAMLTSIFDAIDSQDMGTPEAKEGLKDAVYQIYLHTMPEQSFRNMFIHRKGLAGFSTDLLRNTATTASRMSTQLARLKYAPLLRNTLSAASDSIVGQPELLPFVDEAKRRVDLALSGREGGIAESVAGVANKVSYVWYLSSAASALIQPFSVVMTGIPVLGANHGNMAGAAKEIAKMMTLVNQYGTVRKNVDGTTSWSAPSLANSNKLSGDERRAVREMTDRGVQESTYASLVWQYKRTPSANLDSITEKGKQLGNILVGGLMHNTERLTREAIYLASYRLGRQRGLSFDEAVDQAVADTNESLADYDVSNRPRWMQQGLGRVAFQFKMYPLHMILLLATNFKRMLPFLNAEGKAEAAKKFFGILGTTGMLAGTAGLPMFSAMMGVTGWAWKQMSGDDDWPEELKDKDFETWFRTVFLREKLGDVTIGGVPVSDIVDRGVLNALTGTDIASRIGLNDLWFRDSKEHKDARSAATAFVVDNFGGPITSIVLGWADAYEAFMLGDYQKGLEKASPAIVRNILIGNRYADEGVKDYKGAELIPKDEVTAGMVWAQRIGFRPDKVSVIQDINFKERGIEQSVLNERARLMKMLNIAYDQAIKTDDYARYDKLVEEAVAKFNRKNPENAIDGDDIYNSITRRIETRESATSGINITEKNARIAGELADFLEEMKKPEKTEAPKK